MSRDNGRPAGLRLVTLVNHRVAKGLLSLVTKKTIFESQGSALNFSCGHFLQDVPVGSYKVRNLVREGEESVFVLYITLQRSNLRKVPTWRS